MGAEKPGAEGSREKIAEQNSPVLLFGFDLRDLGPKWGLVAAVLISFSAHVAYAYLQEELIKGKGFQWSWCYVIVNCLYYAFLSFFSNSKTREVVWEEGLSKRMAKVIVPVTVTVVIERSLGIMCLRYIDYVTKVVFQSAKAIPVLLIGTAIFHKRYSLLHYLNAFVVAVGCSLISLADAKVSATFNALGIFFASGSVVGEALKSTLQEQGLRNSGLSPSLLVFWTNGLGFLMTLPIAVYTGDFHGGLEFFSNDPSLLFLMLAIATAGFVGTIANVCIIALSDAYTCTVVSASRKLVTILVSVVAFGKAFNWMHYAGIFFSVCAAVLTGRLKRSGHKKAAE